MEEELYRNAKKKVKLKKGFYNHLVSYITTNLVMFSVIFFNGGGFAWLIPAMFWGIGLVSHYFKAFGLPGVGVYVSEEWERREVEKEVRKELSFYYKIQDEEELKLKELQKAYRSEDLV